MRLHVAEVVREVRGKLREALEEPVDQLARHAEVCFADKRTVDRDESVAMKAIDLPSAEHGAECLTWPRSPSLPTELPQVVSTQAVCPPRRLAPLDCAGTTSIRSAIACTAKVTSSS